MVGIAGMRRLACASFVPVVPLGAKDASVEKTKSSPYAFVAVREKIRTSDTV